MLLAKRGAAHPAGANPELPRHASGQMALEVLRRLCPSVAIKTPTRARRGGAAAAVGSVHGLLRGLQHGGGVLHKGARHDPGAPPRRRRRAPHAPAPAL